MNVELISLLTAEAWLSAAAFSQRPADDAFPDDDALSAAYGARKTAWSVLALAIADASQPEELAIIQPHLDAVAHRFAECDAADVSMETGAGRWFWCCEYPDMMVAYRLDLARQAIEDGSAQ